MKLSHKQDGLTPSGERFHSFTSLTSARECTIDRVSQYRSQIKIGSELIAV